MIIQNEPVAAGGRADLSFTVSHDDLRAAVEALQDLGVAQDLSTDERVGKVSIVGAGMRSHPGVAAKVFTVLGEQGVNIEMITTSPIKISCVIGADQVPGAVRALHSAFELGTDGIQQEDPTGVHRPTVA
jgi:aspartate kinase